MDKIVQIATLTLAASLLAGAGAHAETKTSLSLSDLRKVVSVSEPQISPDGTKVAVYRTHADYEKDRNVGDLVLIDVKSHASRVLVADGHISGFHWSPNGSSIAYIAQPKYGEEKSPQLFVLPMGGGEAVQLTHEKGGVDDFDWRPDGKALAYAATPPAKDEKAREHHEDAFDVTGEAWTAQEPFAPLRLYQIGSLGGKPLAVGGNSLNLSHGGFTYTSDGRSIIATRIKAGADPSQDFAQEIVRVGVSNGSSTRIAAPWPSQSSPVRSADGKHIAFLFANPRFAPVNELALGDADAANARWVSRKLDRNLQSATFAPDGSLVAIGADGTRSRFFIVGASGSHVLALGDLNPRSAASISRNGTLVFTASSPTRPPEVYIVPPHGSLPVRLTNNNAWIGGYELGRHETLRWRTQNGMTADGVLVYPPHWKAGKKLPLVLYIHGGPTSASNTSFGMPDVFAAHGWLVFEPNYIGSDNNGVAFASAIVPHVTTVAGPSIEQGINVILKRGIADPARMGISGWSAGGMMTSWLITQDTRFKAAVSGAAVNDFAALAQLSDSKGYLEALLGPKAWVNAQTMNVYRAESPLTYVDRVKTPTLILSDSQDFRVPTPLSYAFYHGLRATGTPAKFVIWPAYGHFPGDPVRAEDVYRQWEAWLATYLSK